jgi:hypothetical protein
MKQDDVNSFPNLQANLSCQQQWRIRHDRYEGGIPSFAAAISDSTLKAILVIEPSSVLQMHIAKPVAAMGYTTALAQTAAEATDRVRRHQPGLIIANVSLPDESGWLFVNKLRIHDRRTPVWLFGRTPNLRLYRWAEFSLVERLIFYEGDIGLLIDTLRSALSKPYAFRRAS